VGGHIAQTSAVSGGVDRGVRCDGRMYMHVHTNNFTVPKVKARLLCVHLPEGRKRSGHEERHPISRFLTISRHRLINTWQAIGQARGRIALRRVASRAIGEIEATTSKHFSI